MKFWLAALLLTLVACKTTPPPETTAQSPGHPPATIQGSEVAPPPRDPPAAPPKTALDAAATVATPAVPAVTAPPTEAPPPKPAGFLAAARPEPPAGGENPPDRAPTPTAAKSDGSTPPGPGRYTTTRITQDGLHDPASPEIGLLQDPAVALSSFPLGKRSELDWVQTLAKGMIQPRANLQGTAVMETLDLDIVMTNTQSMPHVRFPHRAHTEWLACKNCHPKPFAEKTGSTRMNMTDIMRGQSCGACHGRVSFSIMVCERCHSILHKDSPKAWW